MNLEKRREFKHFATWLRDQGFLDKKHILIPYELAELYLESDFYQKIYGYEENIKCDICGHLITNKTKTFPVTNEQYRIIEGLKQCENCYRHQINN